MNVDSIRLRRYKGVDATLPWAPAMVFFGANDSGKTNILEALLSAFGDPPRVRADRYRRADDQADAELLIELDGLELPGNPDQELLLEWVAPMIIDDPSCEELQSDLKALPPPPNPERPELLTSILTRYIDADADDPDASAALADARGRAADRRRWFVVDPLNVAWLERKPPSIAGHRPDLWFDLGEVPDSVGLPGLIRAIWIDANPNNFDDLYARIERYIDTQLAYAEHDRGGWNQFRGIPFAERLKQISETTWDLWLEREDDAVSLRQEVHDLCEELANQANHLRPEFLQRAYDLRITAHTPDEWRLLKRRVSVRLAPCRSNDPDEDFGLEVASSGIARWTACVLSEALRVNEDEGLARYAQEGASHRPSRTTVLVLDEPEQHLHPLAQEEAAAWLADRVASGTNFWIASHSVPFLRLSSRLAEYFHVHRSADGATTADRITDRVLDRVTEAAATLGLPRVALIQLTRGWLVVEGDNDRRILERLYGAELRKHGVQILPLQGAVRARSSFLNLRALGPLGLPFFVLLDNARAEAIKAGTMPDAPISDEEKIVEQLVHLKRAGQADVDPFSHGYKDIACILPEACLIEFAREQKRRPTFTTWPEVLADWDHHQSNATTTGKKPRFKDFVLERLDLKGRDFDDVIARAAELCPPDQPRDGDCTRQIIDEILAHTASSERTRQSRQP